MATDRSGGEGVFNTWLKSIRSSLDKKGTGLPCSFSLERIDSMIDGIGLKHGEIRFIHARPIMDRRKRTCQNNTQGENETDEPNASNDEAFLWCVLEKHQSYDRWMLS